MDYCDCGEFCSRSHINIYKDGRRTAWFCPYIPEGFGGPGTICKKLTDDFMKTTVNENYEPPEYTDEEFRAMNIDPSWNKIR